MRNKVKQSETAIIPRSQITPADYNPRKITDEARKELKKNIKSNGIIGGMVFNKQTGNLVSGHQKLNIADEINKYDPATGENDYDIKVEIIDVDLKKEKELNIFFNSKSVQGEMDYGKLALMMPDIDAALAGLDSVDMSMIEAAMPDMSDYTVPVFEPQEDKKILAEIESGEHDDVIEGDDYDDDEANDEAEDGKPEMTDAEKIAHVKNIKKIVKDGAVYEGEPYFTVSFDNYENKQFFLERFHLSGEIRFLKGEDFAEMLDEMLAAD